MVKKFFRPFICAVCAMMSLICGASPILYNVAAAEETQGETVVDGSESEGETLPVETEQLAESETQTEAETQGETQSEAQSETQEETNAESEQQTESESETEKKESEATEPVAEYDKAYYTVGDSITLNISGIQDANASSATVSYDIPEGTELSGVSAAGADVQYKNANGDWTAYSDGVDSASVKAIRFIFKGDETGVVLADGESISITLKATAGVSEETPVSVAYEEAEETVEKSGSASLNVKSVQVNVSMKQTPDVPTPGDEITQNVSVEYLGEVDSKITYTVDPALNLKKIDVGANTYLEGGTAVITTEEGEQQLPITAAMDLSEYAGITKIVFIPKIKSYEGMNASFTAILKLKETEEPVSSYTCTTDVVVTEGEYENTVSSALTSKVNFVSVVTPAVSLVYDGKSYNESTGNAVDFGKTFSVVLDSLGMTAYSKANVYDYSITTPSFVTLQQIVLPELDGAAKIKVFTADADGNETELGEFTPGETVTVDKNKISAVHLAVTSETGIFTTTKAGSITFSNDNKKNKDGKTQNASFRAVASTVCDGQTYSASSKILTINVRNFKRTEPESEPQTNSPSQSETDSNNPGQTETETPEQTEPETEDPNEETRRQQESERKDQIKKQSLQNEQKMKEKLKSLLQDRVNQIKGNASDPASGGTATSTGTATKAAAPDKYADWTIKPIFDTIVSDLIPKDLLPISEGIVENIVPSQTMVETEVSPETETETISERFTSPTETDPPVEIQKPETESEKETETEAETETERKKFLGIF